MINRINKAGVGVRNPHGGLRSNKVRAALYYARKNRLSKVEPYVNSAYVDDDYVAIIPLVPERYALLNYMQSGYSENGNYT